MPVVKLRMMHVVSRVAVVAILALATAGGRAVAGDLVIDVSKPWSFKPASSPWSAAPAGAAVVAYRFGSDDETPYEASLVLQVRDGVETTTEFPGKVFALEYSADGQRLLVHHSAANDAAGTFQVHMLVSSGAVLWSKSTSRVHRFTVDGEAVYTTGSERLGRRIEILNLDGNQTHSFDFDAQLHGVEVFGAGPKMIAATGHTIRALSASTSPPAESWRLDLTGNDPKVTGIEAMAGGGLLVLQEYGAFLVLSPSGQIMYRFNPGYLGATDQDLDALDLARFRPYELAGPDTLLLFSTRLEALELDLSTGSLTPRFVDVSEPPGYRLRPQVVRANMILAAGQQVRIRPVALD